MSEKIEYQPGFPMPAAPTPVPDDAERDARMAAMGFPPEYRQFFRIQGTPPLSAKAGMVFEEMSPEKIVSRMPVAGNEQTIGILHGGAHLLQAETLSSIAALLHVRINLKDEEKIVVGTELGATHHRQAREGWVYATCTPINLGRQMTSHEIVMTNEEGKRLSTARMTNLIIDQR
ncbi:hotdog fold thioesterase [Nesterenkonia populi]|uniref:hotdog fold thioesterase n=1 Tax=Nesterenkonia populi TaxID=1591087 RepID=UPI0011BDCE2E|nr:hotdog fold thioesterase [Nesterenkonia populi]